MQVEKVLVLYCCRKTKNRVKHPVCYFSKKFNKHQINCGTIEKKSQALLLVLQHLEVYVGSHRVPLVVFTDHNPLVFLCPMSNANQCLL